MDELILDFEERTAEIEKYINFVWLMDNLQDMNFSAPTNKQIISEEGDVLHELQSIINDDNSYDIDPNLVKTLKGNCFLLLYNLAEGTVTAIFNEFFASFNNRNLKYKDCSEGIQKIWLQYKHRVFQTNESKSTSYVWSAINDISENIIQIETTTNRNGVTTENYDAYKKKVKDNEISGNLTPRKIRQLLEKFGLPQFHQESSGLYKTTNKRNSLAHGNETFSDVGRLFTVEELILIKKDIFNYFSNLLQQIKLYIDEENFIVSNTEE